MKKAKSIPDPGPLRLLIVEDSPADAELIQRELRRAGIHFTSRLVEDKKEFNKSLADFQPQVILSDFKMPSFDGLAALKIARLRTPDIPFIFVSGSIGEDKAIETLTLGAADYILKDNLARLGPAIKRVVEETQMKLEKEKNEEELQLLAEAADRFVHINDLDKIYDYLASTICGISGADYLLLSLYDDKLKALRPKIAKGFEPFRERMRRRFHSDPMEMVFYLKDMRQADFNDFISRRLLPVRDGLYGLSNRKMSRPLSRLMEKLLGIGDMHSMGFSWENQLFGGLTVFFKKGNGLKNGSRIEALVNLAAVAIKRLIAEKSLSESERMFSTLVANLPGFVYRCRNDKDWTMEYISEGCLEITGYAPEDFINSKRLAYNSIIHPDHQETLWQQWQEDLAKRRPFEMEYRIISASGDVRWVWERGQGVFGRDGSLQFLEGFITNVTRRRQMEDQLRQSEKKYRTLVTQSPDGIFVTDLLGNFLSVNQAICAGLNYSEAELLSLKIWDIVPEEFMGIHKKRLADILKGEAKNEAAEYKVIGKDDEIHYVDILSAPFYKDDELIGFQGIARDVTEKKKMEIRLRESEEYYRTLVETSPDAIVIIDAGGRCTFASSKAHEVFGIPAPISIIGTSIMDFIEPDEIPRVQGRLVETLSGRSLSQVHEYRLLRHDHQPFWGEISSAPLQDASGRNISLLLICRDISERKQAENALYESEEKYRLIADNTAETISVLDLDLKFTYISPSIIKLRGFTVDEAFNQTLQQTLTPDSFAKIQEIFKEEMALEASGSANPRRSRSLELQEYRKDGSIVWVENSMSYLRNPQGKAIGFLAVSKDISERKLAEVEILREKAFLEALVETAPEGIAITDRPGRILQVNGEFVKMFGYGAGEAVGKRIDDLLAPPEYLREAGTVTRSVGSGKTANLETVRKRKDGTLINVSIIGTPVYIAEEQVAVYAIYRDVTERKRAEERIQYQAGLLQNVSDAIIATDQKNDIQAWNQAAERIYGWKAVEIIGKNFHEVIKPEYRFQSREEVAEKLERDGAWSGEIIHHLRNGRQIPVQSTITILKDASGNRSGLVSINHDISERLQAEELLRERDQLLKNLSAQVPGMIYTFLRKPDGTYRVPYSSNAIQDIFGVSPQEVLQDAAAIFNPILAEDKGRVVAAIEDSARTLRAWQTEYRVQLPGQPMRWMLGQSDPVRLADGSILWYGFNTDITERKHAEELIRNSLKEKEVLLQEIHHRVKNNLQIISGLLTLQADRAAGKSLDDIFRESQDRIRSIALIHEKLYRSHNLAEIAFDEYLRALTENLFISHGVAAGRITAKYEMESIFFTIEKAIPLGLIVNELVSNSLKHAFPAARQGEIRIGLHGHVDTKSHALKTDSGRLQVRHAFELTIADNGVGLPAGWAPEQQKSLGMHLVSMLTQQLQAELKIKKGPGVEFELTFSGLATEKGAQ